MPTTTMVPADPTVGGHRGWRVVAALAVTSTIGYRDAGQCSALQGGGEGLRWEGRQGSSGA